jgi:predicted phosphodiesterase
VHATPEPVAEALALFKSRGVDRILCPGDIAGYGADLDHTVALLLGHDCQAVLGNHEIWHLEEHATGKETPTSRWFGSLPRVLQLTIEGKRLYMVHASPPDSVKGGIRLLDIDGNLIDAEKARWSGHLEGFGHDVLLVGHTHQVFCEQLGNTLVINPGSTLFNHTCAILSLPELSVEWFGLSGKQPVKTWNWADEKISGDKGNQVQGTRCKRKGKRGKGQRRAEPDS